MDNELIIVESRVETVGEIEALTTTRDTLLKRKGSDSTNEMICIISEMVTARVNALEKYDRDEENRMLHVFKGE